MRCACLLLLLVPLAVAAQDRAAPIGDRARVYVGGGVLPGVGVIAEGTAPVLSVFTREVVLYADYTPRVAGGSGRLETAVGVGGGLRALRLFNLVGNRDPGALDIDLGIRIGPSFTAFADETAASRARSFSVMLDPFARVALRRRSDRVFFAEVGTQSPSIRAGLSTSIRFGGR